MRYLFFIFSFFVFITSIGQENNIVIIDSNQQQVEQDLPIEEWGNILSEIKSILNQKNYENDPRCVWKGKTSINSRTGIATKTAHAALNYNGHIIELDTIFVQNKINELKKLNNRNYSPIADLTFPDNIEHLEEIIENKVEFSKTLKNGTHIGVYKPIYDLETKLWVKNKLYIKYEIGNRKLIDTTYFFDLKGNIIAKGTFKDNKKNGVWIFHNKKDSIHLKNIVTYKNGVRNGMYKYYENSILISQGVIKNEMPIGEWKIFHEDGKLANSMTFLETPIVVNKTTLNNFTRRSRELPSGSGSIFFPGFNFIRGKQFQTIQYLEETVLKFYLDGEFQGYYSNGQQMCNWTYVNGIVQKDNKVYNPNGTVLYEWRVDKNRNKVIFIMYNDDGSIKVKRKL